MHASAAGTELKEIEPGEKRKYEEKDDNNKKRRRLTILEYMRKPKERKRTEKDQEGDKEQEVRYGEYEKGGWMEKDFWDKYLEKREENMKVEEEARRKRIEKARRQEKSWELIRVVRDYIEEVKTNSWFKNKEIRREKEKVEKQKQERIQRAGKKKSDLNEKIERKKRQQSLLEMMKRLPAKEREVL